jgi:arylsulfatase A-like enzyme
VTPFDFDLDPAEEYTLASAFNNLWWTVRVHNDQATRANIAAQNALVDAAIGRVVGAIDEEGRGADTLVVVTTDQGNPYGQHGLWGHPPWTDPPFMHDVTFRVPLIFRRPGSVPAWRERDENVSHVDLLPTLLDYAGVDAPWPADAPGRSFAPMLRGGHVDDWVDAAFFENETARAIRTTEHLYVAHMEGTGEAELYDLVADPDQLDDVAASTVNRRTVEALSARLDAFFDRYVDPRYDLWQGGTAQAMVSRYLFFKQRYGSSWEVTTDVAPAFTG